MMKTDRISKALLAILEDEYVPACERVKAARILRDLGCWNDLPEPEGATFTEEQMAALEQWMVAIAKTFTSGGDRGWWRWREEREVKKAFNVENNT